MNFFNTTLLVSPTQLGSSSQPLTILAGSQTHPLHSIYPASVPVIQAQADAKNISLSNSTEIPTNKKVKIEETSHQSVTDSSLSQDNIKTEFTIENQKILSAPQLQGLEKLLVSSHRAEQASPLDLIQTPFSSFLQVPHLQNNTLIHSMARLYHQTQQNLLQAAILKNLDAYKIQAQSPKVPQLANLNNGRTLVAPSNCSQKVKEEFNSIECKKEENISTGQTQISPSQLQLNNANKKRRLAEMQETLEEAKEHLNANKQNKAKLSKNDKEDRNKKFIKNAKSHLNRRNVLEDDDIVEGKRRMNVLQIIKGYQEQEEKRQIESEKFSGSYDRYLRVTEASTIQIGNDYQAAIPTLVSRDGDKANKKQLTCVWDPSSINENDLTTFMNDLQNLIGYHSICEEKAIKLLLRYELDGPRALISVSKNKTYYKNLLSVESKKYTKELKKLV